MMKKRIMRLAVICMMAMILLAQCMPAMAEADTRWADAADEIDKFLDAAFESYLDGDASAAYDNVSNAYFRVYETTGFERQTLSYISGNRKNAVEMQFSACKAAVKLTGTLSREEAMTLWRNLHRCEQPFFCPHGRPTMLKMTPQDLVRHFGRSY